MSGNFGVGSGNPSASTSPIDMLTVAIVATVIVIVIVSAILLYRRHRKTQIKPRKA